MTSVPDPGGRNSVSELRQARPPESLRLKRSREVLSRSFLLTLSVANRMIARNELFAGEERQGEAHLLSNTLQLTLFCLSACLLTSVPAAAAMRQVRKTTCRGGRMRRFGTLRIVLVGLVFAAFAFG